jgi:hypothetical protein
MAGDYDFIANSGANMLGQFRQLAETRNAVNQNLLFQGQQLAGQALQQAVDPSTGQVDFGRAASLIGQNRQIGPYAMKAMTDLLSARGQDISNTTNYGTNLRRVVASVTPGPDMPARMASAVTRAAGAGLYPMDMATRYLGGSPMGDGSNFGADAKELASQAAIALNEAAPEEAQAGSVANIDTGGNIQPTAINRFAGTAAPVGAPIAKTLSPEAKATTRTYTDAQGVTHTVPLSATVTDAGEPKPSIPGLTGRRGEMTTSLPPGEAESLAAPKAAQAQQSVELGRAFEGSNPRAAQLDELRAIQGDFRSGPGAAKWSGIVGEFNRVFNTRLAADPIAAQQTFGKIAEQVAEAQRGAMGSAATNAQTEAARIASPNTTYSPETNMRVIALLRGNEDFIQQKQKAWQAFQAHGGKPSQYNAFVGQFNNLYDPRYYQEGYMTPAQKAEMQKAMNADQLKRFETKRKQALSLEFGP